MFSDGFDSEKKAKAAINETIIEKKARENLTVIKANDEELKAHHEFVDQLKNQSGINLWEA